MTNSSANQRSGRSASPRSGRKRVAKGKSAQPSGSRHVSPANPRSGRQKLGTSLDSVYHSVAHCVGS